MMMKRIFCVGNSITVIGSTQDYRFLDLAITFYTVILQIMPIFMIFH